jgi:signal transduction histidine kinase
MADSGSSRDEGANEADKDRLTEELREAVQARDELVAFDTHELPNPMTPILMQVSRLLGATKDPRRCRPELIGPRMEVLEPPCGTSCDARPLSSTSRALRLEASGLGSRKLTSPAWSRAWCFLEPDLKEGIVGRRDRLALEQVVENLLSASIKFGAGRPISIVLRSDRRNAELTLRDQAIGISEEDRARIFQYFERAGRGCDLHRSATLTLRRARGNQ